jgi:hypothetical protein
MYALVGILLLVLAFSLAVASSRTRPRPVTTVSRQSPEAILTVQTLFFTTSNNNYRVIEDVQKADVFRQEFLEGGGNFYLRNGEGRYLSLSNIEAAEGVSNLRLALDQSNATIWQQVGNQVRDTSTNRRIATGDKINANNVSGREVFAADIDLITNDAIASVVTGTIYHISRQKSKQYFNPEELSGIVSSRENALPLLEVPLGDGTFHIVTKSSKYLSVKNEERRYTTSDSQEAWWIVNGQPVLPDRGMFIVPAIATGAIRAVSEETASVDQVLYPEASETL